MKDRLGEEVVNDRNFFFWGGEGLIFGCKIHYIMRFLKLNYKLGCKPVFYPTPTMAEKSSLGRPK